MTIDSEPTNSVDSQHLIDSPEEYESRDRAVSQIYRLYRYRFVVMSAFIMCLIQNQAMWNLFYNIDEAISTHFGLNYNLVNNGTSVIQNWTFLPGTLIASYVFDQISVRAGCIAGGILTLAGIWLRVLSTESFWFVIIGQGLGGIAQPFFFNSCQKISSVWFGPKERNYSTTAMFVMGFLGPAYSSYVPNLFLSEKQSNAEFQSQFNLMMWYLAVGATIVMLPSMLLIRSKPPTPSGKEERKKKAFWTEIKLLFKNKNFLLYLIGVSFNQAASISQSYQMSAQYSPYGINIADLGVYNTLSVFVAIPGAFISAWVVTKISNFKFMTILLSFGLGIGMMGYWLTAVTRISWLIGFYFCFVNFLAGPYVPLSLEFVVELTYPIGETTSAGLLNLVPELLGIPLSWICNFILEDDTEQNSFYSFAFFTAVMVLSAMTLFCVKEDLRRLNKDKYAISEEEAKKSLIEDSSNNSVVPITSHVQE